MPQSERPETIIETGGKFIKLTVTTVCGKTRPYGIGVAEIQGELKWDVL